jgi:phosphonate transport system substrate-binding protein
VSSDAGVRVPLEKLASSLSRRLPVLLYPQIQRTYGALATQLHTGGLDVAWLPPMLAAEALVQGNAELVASVQRELGGLYHAVIFTRKDSGLSVLTDLKGRSMAWVDRASAAGYVVPKRWLEQNGHPPSSFFGRETFLGTHADAVAAVLRGSADAGATYAVLEPRSRKILDSGWTSQVPSQDMIHVIASAGAVPSDAIAVSTRVEASIRTEIGQALLQLDEAERELALQVFRAARFETCAPVYLDMLRRLLEAGSR